LIGSPWVEDGKLYNACALLDGGRIAAVRFKANLPNYGVFDEKRLFARGPAAGPVTVRGIRIGVPICEDIWLEESEDYENIVECLAETGAEILVVPNGSPYARDKGDVRLSIAVARVTESGLPLVYLNQVGGQDELVFDGASFALNADLSVAAQLPAFAESITTLRWRAARRLRRHRLGALRGDRGRCAGGAARPRRDAAVPFYSPGVARRRGKTGARARHPLRGAADRAGSQRF
jgi:NAD+ synthase